MRGLRLQGVALAAMMATGTATAASVVRAEPGSAFPDTLVLPPAVLDILPTALTVVMSDSTHNPESDSITISLTIMVKGGSTPKQALWSAAQIGIEGVERMNGIVDSGQVMAANTQYTYRIGAWVDKKPFSVIAFTDPDGIPFPCFKKNPPWRT
jgi:hypothetical protein